MKHWYVKELAKLTHVSVKALHHYDRIGLLHPSFREDNGYRLYSETDLFKLQRIVALKFFGFELAEIKALLEEGIDFAQLTTQSRLLKEKAKQLLRASESLDGIIAQQNKKRDFSWQIIIQSMEIYHMMQEVEKDWTEGAFSSEEFKQLAEIRLKAERRKDHFEREWKALIKAVEETSAAPESAEGQAFAKRMMTIVNAQFGPHNTTLRNKSWEAIKEGKAVDSHLSGAVLKYLDAALNAYYRSRVDEMIRPLLTALTTDPTLPSSKALAQSWQALITEMFGGDPVQTEAFLELCDQAYHIHFHQDVTPWLVAASA